MIPMNHRESLLFTAYRSLLNHCHRLNPRKAAVTFFGTAIAAMILPYRKKSLYANSPIARYRLLGLPLITVTGFITAAFLGFNLWHWFTNDLYAVNNSESLWFMGIMYGLALIIYVVAKVYRKRQGIDLSAVYKEIPVE